MVFKVFPMAFQGIITVKLSMGRLGIGGHLQQALVFGVYIVSPVIFGFKLCTYT
jgi:hypothetical protein